MQRKFNRRTVYAYLHDVVPAVHHGNIKKRGFFIGPLYERQRFYHLRSLETLQPRLPSPWFGISKAQCENERNKTSVVSLVSRWDTITGICSACEGYEKEEEEEKQVDDHWNIPKIYLHKNMNIIPIIFQLLLAFSPLFHSVSIYSKKTIGVEIDLIQN